MKYPRSAGWQPAVQQVSNLRYGGGRRGRWIESLLVLNRWDLEDLDERQDRLKAELRTTVRDSAILAFVESIDGYQPDVATKWATAIGDETQRIEAVAGAAHRWLQADAAAARIWIEQSDLPMPIRARLLMEAK